MSPITPVTMYRLTCDGEGCGREVNDEYYAWLDEDQAAEEALNSDWHEIDGKYFCYDCVIWDEEKDELVPSGRPIT